MASFDKKIRDLKTQVDQARTDINGFARQGLRLFGQGEVFPVPTGEPQKTFMWEVSFRGTGRSFQNAKLYAKNASIPQSSVETIEQNFLGNKMFHAGKDASSHTLNITFWDNENMEVYRFLQEWINLLHDPAYGAAVRKTTYSKIMTLRLKDTADVFTTGDFHLHECFPSEISEVSLSYDVSDAIEISATFYFDYKYAGKPPQNGGIDDAFKSYLNLDSYVSSFTGDFDDFADFNVPDIGEFF